MSDGVLTCSSCTVTGGPLESVDEVQATRKRSGRESEVFTEETSARRRCKTDTYLRRAPPTPRRGCSNSPHVVAHVVALALAALRPFDRMFVRVGRRHSMLSLLTQRISHRAEEYITLV